MFRLLRYFSIASLISVALAAVILGALYRQIATSHLRELGESNNVALAQIFANSIWPQYRAFADTAKTLDADALRRHPEIGKLHRSVLEVMSNTQVVKVKLYQRNGRTFFSTDPAQIGKDYSTNLGFISAIQGKPVSEITHREKFSTFDEELEHRDVLSSYIPLRSAADAPIEGVLEIYSDVTDLLRSIAKEERLVFLIVVGVLTVLYSVLFFIARHADGVIRSQYRQSEHMATHDALTGLPNRALLLDRINQSLAAAERHGSLLAVAFIDLDNFKNINDTMGHHIGDKVLQVLAHRLSLCLRKGDTLARLGGDEFVISLPDIHRDEDLLPIVQKLHNAIALPVEAGGHKLHLTASIGISHQEHGRDVDTLMRNADTAMYHAKQLGRNRHLIFADHMGEGVQQRVKMESEMRRALENREFALYYQPIVDLESGAIVGAEALLRWPNATGAWIPPAEFIPVAEECGLIVPLSEWVLGEACDQLQAWRALDLGDLTVAVNLSARHFASPEMAAKVAAVIERTRIDPDRLHLEITEGLLVALNESILANFEALRRMGVKFAIDDFGIGYSSLGYLRRLSIDMLKIDYSFMQDLPGNADNAAIVTAVIAMANGLGLTVIAEGIEFHSQLAFLRQLGCHRGQGFLFGHPMSAAEFLSLASERLDMRATA